MKKGRLEAFSDGVFAILITVMVLELRPPDGAGFSDLEPLLPILASYFLSYVYLAIYWNNHHHLFQAVDRVNGRVLWANAHLLFWLSLVPFGTAWVGRSGFAPLPVAVYGVMFLAAGMAFRALSHRLMAVDGPDSRLGAALGRDYKGKISLLMYAAGIALAYVDQRLSCALYVLVALIWFVPDRRIERALSLP